MKTIFQAAIRSGNVKLADMLRRIDSYHIRGKLTEAERDELYAEARAGATPEQSTDLFAKVLELDARVKALESKQPGTEQAETAAQYTPGKWYYSGDVVRFAGKHYTCCAPDGAVCTWSPAEYPAYWQEVAV